MRAVLVKATVVMAVDIDLVNFVPVVVRTGALLIDICLITMNYVLQLIYL